MRNSSSEKEKGTRSKSLEYMKLRRAKEANQNICAIKNVFKVQLTTTNANIFTTLTIMNHCKLNLCLSMLYTIKRVGLLDIMLIYCTVTFYIQLPEYFSWTRVIRYHY